MTDIRGIDRAKVDSWLAANVPGATAPFDYQLIAAGGSNLTFRVTDADGHAWALRRPPVGHALPTAHDMSREWRIMAALEGNGVPVPACIAYCDDLDVNGAPFYVMGFVDGLILRDPRVGGRHDRGAGRHRHRLTHRRADRVPHHRHRRGRPRHPRQARRLHAVASSTAGARRSSAPTSATSRSCTSSTTAWSRPSPPRRRVPGLAHGDYRFDNTVIGDDFTIAAVLDWELCTIGNPVADFAWSMQYWADPGDTMSFLNDPPTLEPVFVRSDEVIRRYEKRSGLDLSDLPYYTVFSWWKQACIVEGVYARRLAGATGGATTSGDPSDIARRVDAMLDHAAELATGVV